jgi:hypothetical protein
VTNHTCAIHPPLSSHPPKYSGEAYQTQDWMRDGYTKGLVSYGGNRMALASSWKSKGAARRIVKDKGSGLIKPIETHRKRTDQCKELEDSDAAKQRSPGLCRDKAEA